MCMRGRESVRSKRASKQFERRWTSGSASGVNDAARGATAGRRRRRTAWELASSAKRTRMARLRSGGVQPGISVFFGVLRDATARSCSLLRRVAAMRRSSRDLSLLSTRFGCASDRRRTRLPLASIDEWVRRAGRDPSLRTNALTRRTRRSCTCRRRASRRATTSTRESNASARRAAPRAARSANRYKGTRNRAPETRTPCSASTAAGPRTIRRPATVYRDRRRVYVIYIS